MESVLASSDKTPLVGELALGLKEGAPYVISTNDATVYSHTPQVAFDGTNVLTLNISSATQWLDPLSHAITFLVKNRAGTPLQFVSVNPAILFRRMETRLGGCLIDDITDFNRLSQLFTLYQSTGKRLQTALALGHGRTCSRTHLPTMSRLSCFAQRSTSRRPFQGMAASESS